MCLTINHTLSISTPYGSQMHLLLGLRSVEMPLRPPPPLPLMPLQHLLLKTQQHLHQKQLRTQLKLQSKKNPKLRLNRGAHTNRHLNSAKRASKANVDFVEPT
jgi:hypothetical protein